LIHSLVLPDRAHCLTAAAIAGFVQRAAIIAFWLIRAVHGLQATSPLPQNLAQA